jgi:hypothetical protein
VRQVLRWARAHRRHTGHWPTRSAGPVAGAPGETWSAVGAALQAGCRGLPAGLTLRGLQSANAVPRAPDRGRLTVKQILTWADAHKRRTGDWPGARSGPIPEAPGDTWRTVETALRNNWRGLRSGQTLVQFLIEHRGVRSKPYAPALTEARIVAWARAQHKRTGTWPNYRCGAVAESPGDTWRDLDEALRHGSRGLEGGTSLAALLGRRLGIRNRASLPSLTPEQIITWARAYHRREGAWPTGESGPIPEAPGETWKGVDMALHWGYRGLEGGTTLARLLAQRLGVRNRTNLPPLTEKQILAWARAYRRANGHWPDRDSGPIAGADGESWGAVEQALRVGYRGLPGGSSLAALGER